MRHRTFTRRAILSVFAALLLIAPAGFSAPTTTPPAAFTQAANIGVNGFFSADRAQRGRTIQAAIVMDIPQGYHVNASKPLGKYAIPTTLKIEAPDRIQISPVSFPRAAVRRFKFSKDQLAVYEGRAVMRFNITIPVDYEPGVTELRARLRFQSCTDEVCFPPATREVKLPIGIVGANDAVRRINADIFGGGGSNRRPARRRRG